MKTFKILLAISVLALLHGCGKEKDAPADKVYKTIHYCATAVGGDVSKATLNGSDQYVFEADDRLFVCDVATNGSNLYGVLTLISGAGNRVAYFEGDLACAEDFELADSTPISVTLVGASSNDKVHTVSGGKVTSTEYPSGQYATSLQDAIQKFSHFTCTTTYDATTFSLSQQSTFLIFSVKMSPSDLPDDTAVTASIINGSDPIWTGTVTSTVSGSTSRLSFVVPFAGGTTLSSASLACTWTGGTGAKTFDDLSDGTLAANNYYTVSRSTLVFDGFRITATENGTNVYFNYYNVADGIEYSLDSGETWNSYTSRDAIPLNADDEVCFRGQRSNYKNVKTDTYETPNNTPVFTANKLVYISGNVMSLLADDDGDETTIAANAFNGAFSKGTTAIDYINIHPLKPLILPAVVLGEKCYKNMFRYCTNLTSIPSLPATTVAVDCYRGMFRSCTALESISIILPASQLYQDCYREMFRDCTGLASVSSVMLPATNLAESCYQQMFSSCSFITPPALPATTLAPHCYDTMFSSCTNMTSAPDLNATTLVTYCYYQMFNACSNLASVKCLATSISATKSTENWMKSVKSSGTFTKASSMSSWTTGANGIPSGWTVVNNE